MNILYLNVLNQVIFLLRFPMFLHLPWTIEREKNFNGSPTTLKFSCWGARKSPFYEVFRAEREISVQQEIGYTDTMDLFKLQFFKKMFFFHCNPYLSFNTTTLKSTQWFTKSLQFFYQRIRMQRHQYAIQNSRRKFDRQVFQFFFWKTNNYFPDISTS